MLSIGVDRCYWLLLTNKQLCHLSVARYIHRHAFSFILLWENYYCVYKCFIFIFTVEQFGASCQSCKKRESSRCRAACKMILVLSILFINSVNSDNSTTHVLITEIGQH
jgi:hypothetical protein